jgi:aryl-alcohol dehydrogenase-like predicted oxidoreductase
MDYRQLGNSGLRVSALTLGTMTFGGRDKFANVGSTDVDGATRQVDMCLDAGINLIDTADVYSDGLSEEIVGRTLRGRRDRVLLATKARMPMGDGPNDAGLSRHHLIRACEASLRRLDTDYIDLYQAHRPDPTVDLDDTLAALSDLVHAGKVRVIGHSTYPAELIVEAQWVAESRGRERFRCEQPPYSIFARAIETAVLPTCLKYGIGVIPWSPLAGGWLTGKYRRGEAQPDTNRARRIPDRFSYDLPENQRKLDLVEELLKLAADAGVSLTHMAHAFVMEHPAVTSAIIGPRTMEQLTDVLAGADVRLPNDVLDAIDKLVPPGTNVNAADGGYYPPSHSRKVRRRSRA